VKKGEARHQEISLFPENNDKSMASAIAYL